MRISVRGAAIIGGAAIALVTALPAATITLADSHVAMAGQMHSAAAPPAKKCPANFISGTIGGQAKCLSAGQQCQQAQAKDYTKYGFTCTKNGNRYQLNGKSQPKKPAAPAKPTKTAKPTAPAHH